MFKPPPPPATLGHKEKEKSKDKKEMREEKRKEKRLEITKLFLYVCPLMKQTESPKIEPNNGPWAHHTAQ